MPLDRGSQGTRLADRLSSVGYGLEHVSLFVSPKLTSDGLVWAIG